jgi:hypothetical protein
MVEQKIRDAARAIVELLFEARDLDTAEGVTALVFTLATVCIAAGKRPPEIVEWVSKQLGMLDDWRRN